MKIGVDVRSLHGAQKYQGVGHYTHQLLAALARVDPQNSYLLFGTAAAGGLESELAASFQKGRYECVWRPTLPARWDEASDMLLLPLETMRHRVDLFFFPSLNRLAWGLPARSVVVIMDMIPLLTRDEWLQTGIKHRLMYWMATRANRLLTPSENTRRDVHELLGVPLPRVDAVPLAADGRFRPVTDEARRAVCARYDLKRPFILYVGDLRSPTHNRRKNIELLVESLAALHASHGLEHELVLAGKRGEHAARLEQLAGERHIAERVRFTDYVPDDELPALYSAATLFAYPSLYEGFGLPPLQAMACGTPVLTMRVSSLPEVMGEAGCMVDPDDPQDFQAKMLALLTDEQERAARASKGLAWAATFSWDRAAAQTLATFHRAMEK